MAEVVRYVDPDASGTGDGESWVNAYNSLNAWEAAEQTNLDTANDNHVVHCRASSGGDDTTPCTISGWTTSATDDIEVIGDDFPADGVFDDTKYFLDGDDVATSLQIYEDFVTITNLQIRLTTSSGTKHGIANALQNAGAIINIDSCIIKGICSGTGTTSGIRMSDVDCTTNVYNTVIYDFISGVDDGFIGIGNSNGLINVYNCTVYNCYRGIWEISGTINVYNAAVGDCPAGEMVGVTVIDYCITDDGDGTNSQTPLGGDWANEFTNPGTDFSLKSGGNCIGNGTDDPGSGLYSDDIIGTARSSTWDIGAFEFVGAPPVGNPWNYYAQIA